MAERFDNTVLEMIEFATRTVITKPLNLGGTAGAGGGVGGPPGGFIGQLPQYRVAYDTLELATLDTLPSGVTGISGWSLVDNLNHIRFRIEELESGASIIVEDDNNILTYLDTTTLHFSGAGVTVNNLGGGEVQVVITASGGGGGGLDEATADTLYLRLDTTNNPLTGPLDISPTNDYGIYLVTDGDNTTLDVEQYGGASVVNSDFFFGYQEANAGNVNSIFIDGVRWKNGAGVFGGNWIHLEEQGVTKFDLDKDGNLILADPANIVLGTSTGTKIGTSTSQKLGFFNKTPVVQPGSYTPTNVSTDRSYDANSTTVDELADVLGTLITDLKNLGLIG